MDDKLVNNLELHQKNAILKQIQTNQQLPSVEEQTFRLLKNKRLQNLNFNVMLNLPIIVKEKKIFERKSTIKVFKRKKFESFNIKMKPNEAKDNILKPGKIYINEFWSEKYQQQILKDSKIDEQLDSIRGLVRKNVMDLMGEVHNAVKNKYGNVQDEINYSKKMVNQHRVKLENSSSSDDNDQNEIPQTHTKNTFSLPALKSLNTSQIQYNGQSQDSSGIANFLTQREQSSYKEEIQEIINKCDKIAKTKKNEKQDQNEYINEQAMEESKSDEKEKQRQMIIQFIYRMLVQSSKIENSYKSPVRNVRSLGNTPQKYVTPSKYSISFVTQKKLDNEINSIIQKYVDLEHPQNMSTSKLQSSKITTLYHSNDQFNQEDSVYHKYLSNYVKAYNLSNEKKRKVKTQEDLNVKKELKTIFDELKELSPPKLRKVDSQSNHNNHEKKSSFENFLDQQFNQFNQSDINVEKFEQFNEENKQLEQQEQHQEMMSQEGQFIFQTSQFNNDLSVIEEEEEEGKGNDKKEQKQEVIQKLNEMLFKVKNKINDSQQFSGQGSVNKKQQMQKIEEIKIKYNAPKKQRQDEEFKDFQDEELQDKEIKNEQSKNRMTLVFRNGLISILLLSVLGQLINLVISL